MNMIVAVDKNWGIGNNGSLLFSIKQDMKFFKDKTSGKVVVMGRKTLDSFPGGKPLKNRTNIVLTRSKDFSREGVTVCHSPEELLERLKDFDDKQIFVIGGAQIYSLLLPYCDRAYVTHVDAEKPADTHMVNLENDAHWRVDKCSKDFIDSNTIYRFCVYERIKDFI